jgi:Dolichyl-phosphate-mannose-protein mannosyltransferase
VGKTAPPDPLAAAFLLGLDLPPSALTSLIAIGRHRERSVFLAILALGMVGALLGLLDRPSEVLDASKWEQLLDLARVGCTVALTLSLLFGPGVVWRALDNRRRPSLGFLFLPGFVLLAAVALLAWVLAPSADPRAVCFAFFAPVLGAVGLALVATPPENLFDRDEQRALLVVGAVLGLAIGRALWSLGPEGELYGGTISRTLEVGDRPDSRIPYIIPTLISHGAGPYGSLASEQFGSPTYNFSSRGPVPGLASSPIVLMSGGRPPAGFPEQEWSPFDAQGFQAYRLAMLCFAITSFLALWDLVRRIAGRPAAYFGLLLAATTPFLVHEVWFTWPKLLAAACIVLAGICVIERRAGHGGLLAGFGSMMHPIGLLSVPTVGLITLWPVRGARWNRPQIRQAVYFVAGVLVFLVAWRLVNGSHYIQNGFLNYFKQANSIANPTILQWLEARLESLGNTVVPLLLPLAHAHHPEINSILAPSPFVVHFFFQYWNTLPFGVAIIFFPMLLVSLWRALRRRPWPVVAVVLIPLLLFTIYWGPIPTGMLREGLQTWVLTLFAVIAWEQASSGFGWLRSVPARVVLTLRVVEVLLMAMLPTLVTRHALISGTFKLTDLVAVLMMVGFGATLGAMVWRSPDKVLR